MMEKNLYQINSKEKLTDVVMCTSDELDFRDKVGLKNDKKCTSQRMKKYLNLPTSNIITSKYI